jgi:AcrR family transcriptional regulator
MAKDLSRKGGEGEEPAADSGLEALQSLRREELDREGQIRRRLELAALEVSGEVGYRRLTVRRILDRTKVSRSRFYKSFADKADCYTQGYRLTAERLEQDLLRPSATAPNWLAGLRGALDALASFLSAEPLLAKGLLAEVHVAGEPAMAVRRETFERLSRAIDTARRENRSRHSAPPITASFILNAIEASVVRTLVRGEPDEFAESAPDLLYIAVSVYFGEEAARKIVRGGS